MKFAPIPFRKFKELVELHGCKIEKTSKEWEIVDLAGNTVSTFAITHGRRTKGNEVLPIYRKKFLRGLQLLQLSKQMKGNDDE